MSTTSEESDSDADECTHFWYDMENNERLQHLYGAVSSDATATGFIFYHMDIDDDIAYPTQEDVYTNDTDTDTDDDDDETDDTIVSELDGSVVLADYKNRTGETLSPWASILFELAHIAVGLSCSVETLWLNLIRPNPPIYFGSKSHERMIDELDISEDERRCLALYNEQVTSSYMALMDVTESDNQLSSAATLSLI